MTGFRRHWAPKLLHLEKLLGQAEAFIGSIPFCNLMNGDCPLPDIRREVSVRCVPLGWKGGRATRRFPIRMFDLATARSVDSRLR